MLLRNILDSDELEVIRGLFQSAPQGQGWVDGRITSGTQSAIVKSNWQMPETSPVTRQAQGIVLAALQRNSNFLAYALPRRICPPLFNRYCGESNYFGNHIDNALRTYPGSSGYLRTDMSCTLFLSDPDSYDGGELVVCDSVGAEVSSTKLAAGDMIVYSARTVHRVNPVTRGERIASFFWIESMIQRSEERQLLHDLDMAITGLRTRERADESLNSQESVQAIQLTGVYHNLLRMWAMP